MSFIPSVSLPSNALSFAFKRHFSPSDKLRFVIYLHSSIFLLKHNLNAYFYSYNHVIFMFYVAI